MQKKPQKTNGPKRRPRRRRRRRTRRRRRRRRRQNTQTRQRTQRDKKEDEDKEDKDKDKDKDKNKDKEDKEDKDKGKDKEEKHDAANANVNAVKLLWTSWSQCRVAFDSVTFTDGTPLDSPNYTIGFLKRFVVMFSLWKIQDVRVSPVGINGVSCLFVLLQFLKPTSRHSQLGSLCCQDARQHATHCQLQELHPTIVTGSQDAAESQ